MYIRSHANITRKHDFIFEGDSAILSTIRVETLNKELIKNRMHMMNKNLYRCKVTFVQMKESCTRS